TQNSTIQQTVTISEAGTYALSFEFALGWNNPATNGMQVIVDGQVIDTLQPTTPGYQAYTTNLFLEAGTVDIAFAGIGPSDGRGTHIDTVSLIATDTPADAIDDTFNLITGSGSASFNVLANDDGSALTVTGYSGGALGAPVSVTSTGGRSATVSLNPDGTLDVDPGSAFDDLAAGSTDTLTLTYDVADFDGDVDTAQVTLNVTGEDATEFSLAGTDRAVVVDLRDNTVANAVRVLPLGDSITDGLAVAGSYRALLWESLVEDNGLWLDYVGNFSNNPGPNLHDPDHQGIPFGSATTAAADINATLTANPTDIALIMLGTNDVAFENGPNVIPQTQSEILTIMQAIDLANPDAQIYLATVTPRTDPALQAVIEAYNAALPEFVLSAQTSGIDVTLVDMSAVGVNDLYDSVHPNATGHTEISTAWAASLFDNASITAGTFNATTSSLDTDVERVIGSDAGDRIFGDSGEENLIGGGGQDWLEGRGGDDLLTGGSDRDVFAFEFGEGVDTITDFTDGQDLIALSGLEFGTANGQATFLGAQLVGGSAADSALVVSDGAGGASQTLAILSNVSVANLNVDDIL
ncbi:MAG: GDSL-type esterase/lipase family protein, partial [Pseudomonadota bacterium]